MAKTGHKVFVCGDCGFEATRWSGRCEGCGTWNTMKEVTLPELAGQSRRPHGGLGEIPEIISLNLLPEKLRLPDRLATSIVEVDRVLGGGFFPGTVALLAGEPGIGKSTLLLSLAAALAAARPVVYASGEESVHQIQQRALRMGLIPSPIELVATTELSGLLAVLAKKTPHFVIVDSIQTLVDSSYPSAAGSLVQVRECALALQRWAKATGATLVIAGHVTKEGIVAGPRTLEHLVDVVVSLEGDRSSDLRLLRSVKNRFGPTDEVGILAMTAKGLEGVANPSGRFLRERLADVPGSVVTVLIEGTRPLLVEIQALVRASGSPYPKRTTSGIDAGRLDLLLAVLETRAGCRLADQDVFVNVSGGLKVREPAVDLAVILAVASALSNIALPAQMAVFGEVGLSGEIRPVVQADRRLEEAARLGFGSNLAAKTVLAALEAAGLRGTEPNARRTPSPNSDRIRVRTRPSR